MSDPTTTQGPPASAPSEKKDRTHWLYIAVIVAVVLGIVVGLLAPDVGKALKPLGTGFVNLIKMMISPVIFCTIVLGVGSIRQAAKVGKVGGLALAYFIVMSTVALIIGLVVGNILQPGAGLQLTDAARAAGEKAAGGEAAVHDRVPDRDHPDHAGLPAGRGVRAADPVRGAARSASPCRASGQRAGDPARHQALRAPGLQGPGDDHVGGPDRRVRRHRRGRRRDRLVGAGRAWVRSCSPSTSPARSSSSSCSACCCASVTGLNIFALLHYLAREYLLIVSTSSSETALPRLVAKMEHLGVSRPVVGITVPTGYSFNLDGTAIYLTMASLFIAEAMGTPLSISEQISLLLFMIIASKGAAGVTGAGLATLAGGLQSHRPDLVDGVGLIVGIDRFMSEARAVTNFSGNAVATVLIGNWVGEFDQDQADRVLAGDDPFDEATCSTTTTKRPRSLGAAFPRRHERRSGDHSGQEDQRGLIVVSEGDRTGSRRAISTGTARSPRLPQTSAAAESVHESRAALPPFSIYLREDACPSAMSCTRVDPAGEGPVAPPCPQCEGDEPHALATSIRWRPAEWREAFDSVLEFDGADRAEFLLEELIGEARRNGVPVPYSANTPYLNTIPPDQEPPHPGDGELEHQIRSIIRWNAVAIVLRANKESSELGGHIASFQSAATLYDTGFNHFWHAPSDGHGGDLVFVQGHCSPGIYARSFVEGRLTEEQLLRFRQEVGGDGLSSYPHPWLMPDYWQFPTVSMGLGPLMAIYQARFLKYLHNRGAGRHRQPARVGLPRRRRDGRARVAGRDLAGRPGEAGQPDLRGELQPAAPRRPGPRQREDHPGAGGHLPRRRLERGQGDLGRRLGPADRRGQVRAAAAAHGGVRRRRVPGLQVQERRLRAPALLRQVPGAAGPGRGHVRRPDLGAVPRRARPAEGLRRLQGRGGQRRLADGDPGQDGQGLRHG